MNKCLQDVKRPAPAVAKTAETNKYFPDKLMMKLDRDEVKAMRDEFFPTLLPVADEADSSEEQGSWCSCQLFHRLTSMGMSIWRRSSLRISLTRTWREKTENSHGTRRKPQIPSYKLNRVPPFRPVKNLAYCSSLDLVIALRRAQHCTSAVQVVDCVCADYH